MATGRIRLFSRGTQQRPLLAVCDPTGSEHNGEEAHGVIQTQGYRCYTARQHNPRAVREPETGT